MALHDDAPSETPTRVTGKRWVIFISCDDNEQANLRNIADESLGVTIGGYGYLRNVTDNNPTNVAVEHENIHCFAFDKNHLPKEWKSAISDVKDKLIEVGERFLQVHEDSEIRQTAYSKWFRGNKAFLSPP